jgi:hypothetical protein
MEEPERWKQLCELASKEQDTEKLLDLAREIVRLLEEKDEQQNNPLTNPASKA